MSGIALKLKYFVEIFEIYKFIFQLTRTSVRECGQTKVKLRTEVRATLQLLKNQTKYRVFPGTAQAYSPFASGMTGGFAFQSYTVG